MLPAAHTWSLTAISVAAGFAMLWAFGRFSDQRRIERAKRQLRAHLYAFRLFGDEPALILRAQKQLLLWNARYLALMLRPAAVILVPTVVLLFQLDALYGRRPLAAGESAVVTAQLDDASDLRALAPSLEGRGVSVETPPVRVLDERQVSWRVRATGEGPAGVLLRVAGVAATKQVQAGSGLRYVSERRVASFLEWLQYPAEKPLPGHPVRWIEVAYPSASLTMFGFGVHWLLWFCAVSLVTMLLFRRRFNVTF
jgi:hypothetical protein